MRLAIALILAACVLAQDGAAIARRAALKYRQAMASSEPARRQQGLEESESWYRKLAEIDPGNKEAYYWLGAIGWARWYPVWLRVRADQHLRPEDSGPLPVASARRQLREQYWPTIERAVSNLEHALALDAEYGDAMAYLNLLIRERADLDENAEEYKRAIARADEWVQKAQAARRLKPPATQPLRVGTPIQQAKLIRRIDPAYPPKARQERVQGTVRLDVVLDLSGAVVEMRLLAGHPLLVGAAMGAVRQWVYQPTLLNGIPVEVETIVDVNFSFLP